MFTILWLCYASTALSQDDILKTLVEVEFVQKSISEAVEQLEQIANVHIVYSSKVMSQQQETINLKAEGRSLGWILKRLFHPQLVKFKVNRRQILILPDPSPPSRQNLNGYIRDGSSGEALIGATIMVADSSGIGTVSNAYGFYTLSLPASHYQLTVAYLGYAPKSIAINLTKDQYLDISLKPDETQLEEVVILASKDRTKATEQVIGTHKIDVNQLKTLPSLGGEADVLKMVQLLPGIKSGGEGASGLFVRGGNVDQNLILLDEAPVYNPSHFLGFFSAFNADAIQQMEVHKGHFPVQYGGRLSSVVDIRMKEGNREKFGVQGGIGLLASRLQLEGPLVKDKASFIISGRRTYPDIFLGLSPDNGGNKIHFYDLNSKLNFRINQRNHLFLSAYFGRDLFRFFDQYENKWGNATTTLRWNHLFSDQLFSNFTLVYSRYDYFIENFIDGATTFNWQSGIEDVNAKADFSWYINPRNTLKFGMNGILHRFDPGSETAGRIKAVAKRKTLESAVYLGHHWMPNKQLELEYGFRLSINQNLGPATVYQFNEAHLVVDSVKHSGGVYHHNWALSPRLGIRYLLSDQTALKASYARTVQYQQELRNSTSAFSAFYIWLPSNPNLPPQTADQVSLGFGRNMGKQYGLSIELYYKQMHHQIDFVDHASLIQNPNLEADIRSGMGRAFGLELLLEKKIGKLSGWIAYTYSRSQRTIPDINEGKQYPVFHDQPHDLKLILQYEASRRWQFAANWQYSSGKAVNLPIGSYQLGETIVPLYADRNGSRLPDFHRLDISATLKRKPGKRNDAYWVFSILNMYYRKNALSIDILPKRQDASDNVPDPTDVAAIKTYVFGLIPSISYNFKF